MPTMKLQKNADLSLTQRGVLGWLGRVRQLLRVGHVESMEALLAAVDAKDSYTRTHSMQVAVYADAVARRMNLSMPDRRTLQTASLLHDIGKIGVPDRILNKPGRLTDEELNIMRRHPQMGVDILEPFRGMRDPRRIILHHHERYDGAGYPTGCRGEDIPLGSRILAVADAVDTMLSGRTYKSPLSKSDVRKELSSEAGLQFDPAVASVTIAWMDESGLESCLATSA
jgi:putative nucleotidyltransferase with HDIG domain